MVDNIVSEQLSVQSIHMGQLEHTANNHSSMQMGSLEPGIDESVWQTVPSNSIGVGPGYTNVLSGQIPISSNQAQVLEPLSNNLVLPKLSTSDMQMGQMEPQAFNLFEGKSLLPNRQLGGMGATFNNVGSEHFKRKSPMDAPFTDSDSHKMSVPNKRVAQMEHRPWLQQSAPGKLPIQMQSAHSPSGIQRSQPPSKRSASNKAGQQFPNQRNQTGHVQTSSKNQSESSESVRSKLRQSLADALALVAQQRVKSQSGEKNAESKAECASGQTQESSQHPGRTTGVVDATKCMSEDPKESLATPGVSAFQNLHSDPNSSDGISTDFSSDYMNGNGLGAQAGNMLLGEDVSFSDSFFAKDELLQGNGLSWVLEPDMEVDEKNFSATSKSRLGFDDVSTRQVTQDPQTLGTKIEAELFKLFGGVNKKYKEKGRSLLFNLKDRNNPALRERVMSGEILPERLCSMSAEELASEELSQWRMAKAEELAQMVVLPESDVDIRRLVKKTHKGEFQVEVEEQDSVSIDVAIAANSQTQSSLKSEEKQDSQPMKRDQMKQKTDVTDDKYNLEGQAAPCKLTIPSTEGNDLMQGLMGDDEMKDVESLPPIVSLDEFMESLNSEPPFENLPADSAKTISDSDKDDSGNTTSDSDKDDSGKTCSDPDKGDSGKTTSNLDKDEAPVGSKSKSAVAVPKDPPNVTLHKPKSTDLGSTNKADPRHIVSRAESETSPSVLVSKSNHIWEGLLQLNTSATAPVIGVFLSGEKTSAKEWSSFIEIKGRVRLDAFEKFLQGLPMSRSRAVMAVHFLCSEGATESEQSSIIEAGNSYVLDGRVGFAELAPGAELYLCPPHSKTREMIITVLPKDQVDELNAIDNGLIGIIVWRKPQMASTASPNSASHHKHTSKKQHFTSRRHHEKDTNANLNDPQKHPLAHGGPPSTSNAKLDDNEDEDVPPGFGPPATRDEDDLPEFNFSSGPATPSSQFPSLNHTRGAGPRHDPPSRNPPRPADQMRELVLRYGQPESGTSQGNNWQRGGGISVKPWNDDDDDMPEWQPEEARRQHLGLQQVSNVRAVQQPVLRADMGHQTPRQTAAPTGINQAMSLQPQVNVKYGQQVPSWQGNWRVPPGYQSNATHLYGNPPGVAGQQGMLWRRDAPKSSRGF